MSQIFKRETIKFYIPVDYKTVIDNTTLGRYMIPLYINPNSITVNDSKIIQETQTIGGFIVQYWGEKLTEFTVNGNTGSGGIEAINILKSVYRNEQIQFPKILLERQIKNSKESRTSLEDLAATAEAGKGLIAVADVFFDGAVSDTIDSVNETIEFLKNPSQNLVSEGDPTRVLAPTLASFAVSIDMHLQGETHRGYFKSFNVTENVSNYGTFDYTFSFTSLLKTGERKNFMPWHKNPKASISGVGNIAVQSNSVYSDNTDRLSFPVSQPINTNTNRTSTTIREDQSGTRDSTRRNLKRI